ncbi:MAG TPA: RHS repeat-associated core domain-containing protein [Thermoanaerobaculia bacterium]|nr:RHS repeat-associated core domain-containing protein [Thermoanaerobaculia bacterium]
MRRILTSVLLILAASTPLLASQEQRYVVKLDAAAAVDRADAIGAELAATYGGTVESSHSATGETVVIRLSPSRARALATDPRVKSVLPLRTRANAVVEPVNWAGGVSYTYDGAGNIGKIGNDDFLYDDVGRLVQAKVNGATRDYTYDAYGNRKNCTQTNPGAACQFGFGINSNDNHLTGDVTYDAAGSGHITRLGPHGYDYDAVETTTSEKVGTALTAEFLYTAEDERIATHRVSAGSWNWTVRDLDNKVLRELTSNESNTAWTWTKDYVWRNDKLLASRQPEEDVVTTYHYHLDHLGSPRRITDDQDDIVGFHDYHAFGPEVAGGLREPSRTELKYTGHERDSEDEPYGLDYMHARFYDSSLGRFLSIDPVGGSPANPQTWNRYAYARNSPLSFFDPTGEATVLTGTNQRAQAELVAIKDSLMQPEAASRLTITTGSHGERLLGIKGDIDSFAALSPTAATIAEAVRADANIYFYLGGMQYNSGGHAPAYTQPVNGKLSPDESSHSAYVAINPGGLPLITPGGSYENLSSAIQHELGHALAIARGERGTAPGGPRGGTNPFAIDYENKARGWYRDVTGDSKRWEYRSKDDHGW